VLYERFRDKSVDLKDKDKVVELKAIEPPPLDPKTPPPPELPPPPPPKVSTIKFVPPEVVKDEEVKEEMVKVEELKDKQIAKETVEGDPDANPDEIIVEDVKPEVKAEVGIPDDQPLLIAEQMPEFPGGQQAMYKWLGKNIKYPSQAKRMGTEGKVFVTFVVGRDGRISNVSVTRGIGGGCDEESIRAIQAMPAWNPGKQGGRPVPVKYSMPVFFKLEQ
jgi:protein TonB